MAQQLPLIPSVAQYRFTTVLDTISYVFDVRWNGRDESWYLSLLAEDETPIRSGMRVVLGTLMGARSANELFPEGSFQVVDLSGADQDATFDDLGVRIQIWYLPDTV